VSGEWMKNLTCFFDSRAEAIMKERITLDMLCYASGRDSRFWDERTYKNLLDTISPQLDLDKNLTLLEVGCAAGFLAQGLSAMVSSYTGVDISRAAIKAARRLKLANASFKCASGDRLPFKEDTFDRVVSYDVFTNLPEMEYAARIVKEMYRVVKPGGKVLVGSLADENTKDEHYRIAAEVTIRFDSEKGKPTQPDYKPGIFERAKTLFRAGKNKSSPNVSCYFFRRGDFMTLGELLGAQTDIYGVNSLNPYFGTRFNIVYTKPL